MPSRLLAIGDVHGCRAALATLVETLRLEANDTLVMLGDYVDRGPESRQVIDLLLSLRERCQLVTLLGNHEEMMHQVLDGGLPVYAWRRCGGAQTLASYDYAGDYSVVPAEHRSFLADCVPHYETDAYFFVHANYVATEPLSDQPAEALRWQSLSQHLPGPHVSGRIAIVGHSSQKSGEVLDAGHLRCLDTYCHGGGWLTAMDVRTGEIWQADRDGQLRDR
ncbi:MAG: metallophosphoesterase family protein [Planctomycetota bacterium]